MPNTTNNTNANPSTYVGIKQALRLAYAKPATTSTAKPTGGISAATAGKAAKAPKATVPHACKLADLPDPGTARNAVLFGSHGPARYSAILSALAAKFGDDTLFSFTDMRKLPKTAGIPATGKPGDTATTKRLDSLGLIRRLKHGYTLKNAKLLADI